MPAVSLANNPCVGGGWPPPLTLSVKRHAMRLAHTFFLAMLAISFGGCDRSGPPVRFVLPEGFRGVLEVFLDKANGNEVVKSNGTFVVAVPTNGRVAVKSDEFLRRWHTETATYPDGTLITAEAPYSNVLALRGLGSDGQHTSWLLVGTEQEFRIGTRINGSKPLARKLTDDDAPNYGSKR